MFDNPTMRVNIWHITEPYFAMIKIEKLAEKFGSNYPCYIRLEGGTGINYLFCVDISIDVKSICDLYKYEIYEEPYEMDIEQELYNNTNMIYPDYSSNGECFKLIQNNNTK
jgi:hypothetical protein